MMVNSQKGNTSSSTNPATGVKTPSLPIKTTRNDGNKTVSRIPTTTPQGGAKK